jgi:hypothetical protein
MQGTISGPNGTYAVSNPDDPRYTGCEPHGPAFFNSDLALEKGFGMGEGRRLRFRFAAFNFINHALNSFGTGYALQTPLVVAGTSPSIAAYSPSEFGSAPEAWSAPGSNLPLTYEF